jgi:predicted RecB family nuclease
MIEGHADGDNLLVIDNIPNAPIYEVGIVHEYKTINQNGFEKLTSPKPEHRVQAMVYARALDRPIVVYMYLNKNDSNIADFPIAFDPEAWARLESKVQVLLHHYNNKTPPEGEVGFHCRDCKYVFSCDSYRAAQPQRR